jgi:transcriptional regulator with XRE-family HTH domain
MASNKDPVLDTTIAPRLRQLCAERSLSFSELARRTGISRATVTRTLKGQRSAQPAELRQILKTLRVRRRDFIVPLESPEPQLPPQLMLPPPRPQLVEIEELERQLHRALQDRDDLADQVERLCAELRVERSERVNEIAELRDQHMRETVELRHKFHAAQAATLEEAQARDEKASAALGAVVAELNSRDQTASHGPRDARSPRPAPAPSPPPPEDNAPSWAETATGLAVGLGGLALGTWLIASKRS